MTNYIFLFPEQIIDIYFYILDTLTRKPSCRCMPTARFTTNLFAPEKQTLNSQRLNI